MIIDLTHAELMAVACELAHSPDCAWGNMPHHFFVDPDGGRWADRYWMIPYAEPPCTCGYWTLLDSARAKLRTQINAEALP